MKKSLPTAEEVEIFIRALEAGAYDAEASDWCCGRKITAQKRLIPKLGRLVGRPLDYGRESSFLSPSLDRYKVWTPFRRALGKRYAEMLTDSVRRTIRIV